MIRILYFSTARTSVSHSDVDDIVTHAVENNARMGITGALAYNGRNFCQLLEGDEGKVRALIETISKDDRHSGFKVIDERAVEARHYADWSLKRVSELDFSEIINAMQA
ncbi:Activator of photopigment [Sulfitobacter noctilucae]|uniref:BLUF domain-containing protein n=1 Tax=Sulfitobacter noctilucae TaxID=1342302 RepID=UPI000469F050|nr:BLUF domain-containing protein [Sulfitobacter noctilucae]KIN75368.1 Activator of photopigment [Sulfitobacter noctilucae]